MHDAITDSTKHCRMAAPVADNALLLKPNCIYVSMFIFMQMSRGNHEINSLSTVLEYDTLISRNQRAVSPEAQPRVIQPSDCEI